MDRITQKLKMRLPALYLLAASLLFWGLYDRYEAAGPVLLESPRLSQALSVRGNVSGTNGVFSLVVAADGKRADVRFRLPEVGGFDFIRLDGRIRTEGVVRGKYAWSSARLLFIQRDAGNKWIPGTHSLLTEKGDVPWKEQRDEFEVLPDAASAEVVIEQGGAAGLAQFDSIKAQPVRIRPSFPWWRGFFGAAWAGLGVLYFRRCRLDRRRLRVLIFLNALAILAGTLMPSDWIEAASDRVKQEAVKRFERPAPSKAPAPPAPDQPAAPRPPDDTKRIDEFNKLVGGAHRAGHFALFASLCFLVYCSAALERQHPVYFAKVAVDIMVFSAVTESLQHLTLDRTPGFRDWLVDLYGMAAAFAAFVALLLLLRARALLVRGKGRFGV